MPNANAFGHLVLTVKMGDGGEAIHFLAHNPAGGDPLPVYVELGSAMKACRCGGKVSRARLRVVAPHAVVVTRVAHSEVPE